MGTYKIYNSFRYFKFIVFAKGFNQCNTLKLSIKTTAKAFLILYISHQQNFRMENIFLLKIKIFSFPTKKIKEACAYYSNKIYLILEVYDFMMDFYSCL